MTQTQTARDWELPTSAPEIDGNSPGRSSADLDEWKTLVRKVFDIAPQKNWTKSDVARRIDMAMGTFSQWYSGKYTGRLDTNNAKVRKWLSSIEEMDELALTVPTGPDFVFTPTAREIIGALQFAQLMPDFVTVTAAAGTGKTAACLHYARTRPNVWMVTASPHTKTVHGMLVELATELDIIQHNPARLVRAIGSRLKKSGGGTLLIVDEAQNLVDDAINQLRHFVDNYQCGLALVGNDEIYTRFAKRTDGPSFAQLKRRIGKRVRKSEPMAEDIEMILDGWGVTDPDVRRVLVGIGRKEGALGQIDKTLKLATMTANGEGKPVTAELVKRAWANRDVEGL
ncbi:hypothetical protein SAMN04515647_1591 [Cohaesibacter sp. ES.047]|uniref:AAA family ATPase n=1 Tax=Cohaesibacter sp. ES.047 TaxID=1798205 RepID=UPI000BB78ABA|nr:AAA family ATPase [Cohaesibacter sp. ES.047]SNY91369.1 hypothetical protein SAMN04515647_1591 [Cohaesibacter sp. ES.047]